MADWIFSSQWVKFEDYRYGFVCHDAFFVHITLQKQLYHQVKIHYMAKRLWMPDHHAPSPNGNHPVAFFMSLLKLMIQKM